MEHVLFYKTERY